jgi:general secretion pathway protein G
MKKAFTMIELIFVIVVIGILSAVAVPKLAATRDDAEITRARVTVAALRSAIATQRQKNILRGIFTDINGSSAADLLEYGMTSDWTQAGDTFVFRGPNNETCYFKVENNRFFAENNCTMVGMSDFRE